LTLNGTSPTGTLCILSIASASREHLPFLETMGNSLPVTWRCRAKDGPSCSVLYVLCRTGEVPRPVALIQLASPFGARAVRCYLLHIACSGITQSLYKILCSPVSLSSASHQPFNLMPYVTTRHMNQDFTSFHAGCEVIVPPGMAAVRCGSDVLGCSHAP